MDPQTEIKELKDKVAKLEALLFGTDNDTRFQAKVRKQIFDGEHTTGKPVIVNEAGKRYNVQTV